MASVTAFILAVLTVISLDLEEVMSVAIRAAPPLCGKASISIDVSSEHGARTEKGRGSGVEFPKLLRPVKTGDYVSLDFKTDKDAGLLIYLATQDLTNYIQVFLQNGKPRLRMKCGEVQSDIYSHLPSLKDGEFHKIILHRSANKETVIIDSQKAFRTYFNTCPPLDLAYLGGFPSTLIDDVNVLETRRFQGCLKNFRLNESPINEYAKYTSVSTC